MRPAQRLRSRECSDAGYRRHAYGVVLGMPSVVYVFSRRLKYDEIAAYIIRGCRIWHAEGAK